MGSLTEWLPFNDVKSFAKFAIGTVIVLLALKYSGTRKYVA
jgi:hypothetical protein